MTSNFRYLLEPDEREHAVSIMREWIEHGDGESCAATLERLIVGPLGDWIESQADTGNNLFDAARAMLWTTQAMANRFRHGRDPVTPEHVSDLNAKWQELQTLFGHLALIKIERRAGEQRRWRVKGGEARRGKFSPFRHAVQQLARKIGTRDFERVLDEIRRDCEEDSEVMDDLRAARTDPVEIRFQSVDEGEDKGKIYFASVRNGKEEHRSIKTLRNYLNKK